jgi:hypothetical protein
MHSWEVHETSNLYVRLTNLVGDWVIDPAHQMKIDPANRYIVRFSAFVAPPESKTKNVMESSEYLFIDSSGCNLNIPASGRCAYTFSRSRV